MQRCPDEPLAPARGDSLLAAALTACGDMARGALCVLAGRAAEAGNMTVAGRFTIEGGTSPGLSFATAIEVLSVPPPR